MSHEMRTCEVCGEERPARYQLFWSKHMDSHQLPASEEPIPVIPQESPEDLWTQSLRSPPIEVPIQEPMSEEVEGGTEEVLRDNPFDPEEMLKKLLHFTQPELVQKACEAGVLEGEENRIALLAAMKKQQLAEQIIAQQGVDQEMAQPPPRQRRQQRPQQRPQQAPPQPAGGQQMGVPMQQCPDCQGFFPDVQLHQQQGCAMKILKDMQMRQAAAAQPPQTQPHPAPQPTPAIHPDVQRQLDESKAQIQNLSQQLAQHKSTPPTETKPVTVVKSTKDSHADQSSGGGITQGINDFLDGMLSLTPFGGSKKKEKH